MKLSSSRFDMETSRLDRSALKNYTEALAPGLTENDISVVNYRVNLAQGSTHSIYLSVPVMALEFSNPFFNGAALSVVIALKQDGFGNRKVRWPASVSWSSGIVPTLSVAAWSVDIFSLFSIDNGVSWVGTASILGSKSSRKLWTFGSNAGGGLGDGTAVSKSSPIQVGTLTDWAMMTSGGSHTLAVKTDGTFWTFGVNSFGQLGDGTALNKSSPIKIGSLTDWAYLSGGLHNTYAIKTNGTLWAFGRNHYGQIGDGTTVNKSSPVQIGALTTWAAVSAGTIYNSILLQTNGTMWAFGLGTHGQNGDSTALNRSSPVQVGTMTDWASISAGHKHCLALKNNGTLWSFGLAFSGQLGDGTTIDKSSPVQVGSLNNWTAISAGGYFSLGLQSNGTLWSWGRNGNGQLGDGTTIDKSSPVQIGALTNWSAISAGMATAGGSLALQKNGTLWAFGSNAAGRCGDGTTVDKSSPVQIGTLTNWINISARGFHGATLKG